MNLDRPTKRDMLVMRLIFFAILGLWATVAAVALASCS